LPRVLAPRLDWKPTVTIAPYSEPDVARGPFRTLRRPASVDGGFVFRSHPSASRPRQAVAAGPDDPRSRPARFGRPMRLLSKSEPARLETLLALARRRRRERIQSGLEFSLILFALGVLVA